tara:strand:- start:37 stop:366 length:330 start_codon:yes stop_codon:yes gene_type:complete
MTSKQYLQADNFHKDLKPSCELAMALGEKFGSEDKIDGALIAFVGLDEYWEIYGAIEEDFISVPNIYHFHVSGDKVSVHAKGTYWTDDEEVSEFDCFVFSISPTEVVAP